MKIAVIANCHVQPISKGLSALPDVESVVEVPIHLRNTVHFQKALDDFRTFLESTGDIHILTFPNGPSFGELELSNLRALHRNVSAITNIYFSGLHPDITYLGPMGKRVSSPLGDYHSKLALHSFLTRRTVTECIKRFQGYEFERLGFLSEYTLSSTRLLERDQDNDIRFAERFLDLVVEAPSLYTMNHPTSFVFQEYLLSMIRHLALRGWKFPTALLPNYLAHSAWWPVYPEIAEHHDLSYRMPLVFKQPDNLGGKLMELAEFVERSYTQYTDHAATLAATKQAQELISAWGD